MVTRSAVQPPDANNVTGLLTVLPFIASATLLLPSLAAGDRNDRPVSRFKLQTDSMRQLGEFAKVINSSFVFNPYSLVFVVFVPPVPPPPATATGAAEMGK